MFGKGKIRLDRVLYDRAAAHAIKTGYASLDELVAHLLQLELRKSDAADTKKKVLEKMKGLGYLQ